MARNTDFIGFTFNGCHSSEFNIYSVSDGSRYQDNLVPNPIDYTEQVPGGVGQYYFGSDMDIKEFPLSIAYDNLSELQVRELRNWLAPDTVGELIFDERPYKTYTAKISTSPSLSFICFDKYNSNTGKKERVYKGEGSINFVCYYPLGVASGEKKELKYYRDKIDDRQFIDIGGDNSLVQYQINKEVAVISKIYGKTTERGDGDKSPDNPYSLSGAEPTKVTVCGRNLIPYPYTSLPSTVTGISFADNGDGTITVNGTATDETAGRLHFLSNLLRIPAGTYTLSGCAPNGSGNTWCLQVVRVINGLEDWGWLCRDFGAGITFTLTEATDIYIRIRLKKGTVINNGIFKPQLEIGTAATPYTPYTGQAVPLPALEPLYGDGTVNDEYDAVSGVETRRWKRVVFDGTESMRCEAHENGQRYVSIDLDAAANKSVMPISTHYTSSAWTQDNNKVYIPNPVVMVITDSRFTTLQAARDILAAQYAAGAPVTVAYQLAVPTVTRRGPQRIPTYPGCLEESNLIINSDPEKVYYFTDSNASLLLRVYPQKYQNIDEWDLSSGLLETLDTKNPTAGYDHYITLPDNTKGIQLYNPGDKETDFILSFNKPTPMNDIFFTLSNGEQFILNLRSSDTDVEDYGAVSDAEKRVAAMTGGVITIDTKKNRIMYKYGTGENVTEESIYFALKKGQFFKIPKNKTSTGGYNLVIGTTSNIETDSIKISYDYLYY